MSLLAIEWGAMAVHAWRLAGPHGRVEAEESAAFDFETGSRTQLLMLLGTLRVKLGRPGVPTLASGRIAGAGGLADLPAVPCPVDLLSLGDDLPARGGAHLVPGLQTRTAGPPDTLLGEETRLLGALPPDGSALVCLPGPQTRWVRADGRTVQRFATSMTGELRALLGPPAELDPVALQAGAAAAAAPGGLQHHLVHARRLAADAPPSRTGSFLTGLLVAHDVAAMTAAFDGGPVLLLDGDPLADAYAAVLGDRATRLDGLAAARQGLWLLAARAGLVTP